MAASSAASAAPTTSRFHPPSGPPPLRIPLPPAAPASRTIDQPAVGGPCPTSSAESEGIRRAPLDVLSVGQHLAVDRVQRWVVGALRTPDHEPHAVVLPDAGGLGVDLDGYPSASLESPPNQAEHRTAAVTPDRPRVPCFAGRLDVGIRDVGLVDGAGARRLGVIPSRLSIARLEPHLLGTVCICLQVGALSRPRIAQLNKPRRALIHRPRAGDRNNRHG